MRFSRRILTAILVVFCGLTAPLLDRLTAPAYGATSNHARSAHDKRAAKHRAEAKHAAAAAAKHKAALHHAAALANQHHARLAKLHAEHVHLQHLHAQHIKKLAALHSPAGSARAARKAHLQRLAAKQQHLKRLAEKIVASRQRAKAMKAHNARLAAMERKARKVAEKKHRTHLAQMTAKQRSAHAARLAAKAREARLAKIAARHDSEAHRIAMLAERSSAAQSRNRRLRAAHEARLAAHNARLAAHYERVAQWEAWREERRAAIELAASHGVVQWGAYASNVPVQVIMVDLNKPNIKVSALIAKDGIGSSEPFSKMIERSRPSVAVTGTFFSLDNLKPVGDIVIDGSLTYFGGMGTALAITPNNRADMITVPWGRHHDWSGYECVVACGPRLLKHGDIVLDPHAEKFRDSHMLAPNSRIAVGITPGNKLVFAMTRDAIYLGRLAKIMKTLGCTEAMNLDAGTSTGFYCNGQMLARPGRRLTNAIVVHTDGHRDTTLDAERYESGG